jgi:butyrate kinase
MNILALDPGSSSTKIGIYTAGNISKANIAHPREEIDRFAAIHDQLGYRLQVIENYLQTSGLASRAFDAVVGRGGLIRPVEGGVFRVNDLMLNDLKNGLNGQHASNLGGLLAHEFALRHTCAAFIVDPVMVDELWPEARLSGLSGISRRSIFHALNQKASARMVAGKMGSSYDAVNLIVAHMGGGISVGAHRQGKVVDVNNALNGDGPFAPERTGGLPLDGVLGLLQDGKYTIAELNEKITRTGGVYSYLGIVDMQEVERRAQRGDEAANGVLNGLIYQVAKEVGSLAAALSGRVDGIVLTGGLAHSDLITDKIREKVAFIAPVWIEPGEYEIEALISGALRVLHGEEPAREYL